MMIKEKTTPVALEAKDRQILSVLDMDGRATLGEIAKRVRLSKQGIKYKMGALERAGVIEYYYTVINPARLGNIYCRTWLSLQNLSPQREEEIRQYAIGDPHSTFVAEVSGEYSFVYCFWTKDIFTLQKRLNDFSFRFGEFISERQVSLATAIHHFRIKQFSPRSLWHEELITGVADSTEKIDATDYAILKLIARNARLKHTEIARKLKLTPKMVSYRVQQMEKKKIILGYRASFNNVRLGLLHFKVFIDLRNTTPGQYAQLRKYIKSMERSIYITEALQVSDLEFETFSEDYASFHEQLQELRRKFAPQIKRVSTMHIHRIEKISYLPEL